MRLDLSGAGMTTLAVAAGLSLVLVTPLLTYHGTKRTGTVGNALLWGVLGSLVWPVALPVAMVQGFGAPIKGEGMGAICGVRRPRLKRGRGRR